MQTAKKMLSCRLYLLGALLFALLALVSTGPFTTTIASRSSAPSAVATSTPACGLAWRQVSIPLTFGTSKLESVAGLSPTDVWAVGSYANGADTQTLTMHWDGTQWTIVPSPNVGANSTLSSVTVSRFQPSNGVWA